jgi:hypothetical protein
MSSNWKQYGGTKNLSKDNNITTHSLVCDNITIRSAYVGTFNIEGGLNVTENAHFAKDVDVSGNVTAANFIGGSGFIVNDLSINGNLEVMQNTTLHGNTRLFDPVFLGQGSNSYIYGNPTQQAVGWNTMNPQSTLDIVGTRTEVFNVYSTQPTNRNIIARNQNNHGIVVQTSDISSSLQFYNNTTISSTSPDAQIFYRDEQILELQAPEVRLKSKIEVSAPNQERIPEHIYDETAVIYDISNGTYLYGVYNNPTEKMGNALTLVTTDTSSVTFLNIVTPEKKGLSIGGGVYPLNSASSMGTWGFTDPTTQQYVPIMTTVSGTSNVKDRGTMGINTYAPRTNTYALDINGPLHITHGTLTPVIDTSFQIIETHFQGTVGMSVGTPSATTQPFYQNMVYSVNGGQSWTTSNINSGDLQDISIQFNAVYVFNATYAFVGGESGFFYYTPDGGVTWDAIAIVNLTTIKSIYVRTSPLVTGVRVFYTTNTTLSYIDLTYVEMNSQTTLTPTPVNIVDSANFTQVNYVNGFATNSGTQYIYVTGINTTNHDIIAKYTINLDTPTYTSPNALYNFNAITVFSDQIIMAVGTGSIYWTSDSGTTWTNNTSITSTMNSVSIYDTTRAMAVGNNSTIVYSNDGFLTWQPVPTEMLNASGNGADFTPLGKNWSNPDYFQNVLSVACSFDAKYILKLKNSGYPHLSSDYGVTFMELSIPGFDTYLNHPDSAMCMSANGQYQLILVLLESSDATALRSSDYGITWTMDFINVYGYYDFYTYHTYCPCCMSSTGQHQYVASPKSDFIGFIVYASHDYGTTWSSQEFIRDTRFLLSSLACSSSGEYVSFCINDLNIELPEYIYNSTDYGATYTPIIEGYFNCVSMSESGQYRTAISNTPTTYANTVYNSADYGITYTAGVTLFSDSGTRPTAIAMTSSGKYQTVIHRANTGAIYISTDLGRTWNGETMPFYGQITTERENCVCMSSNGGYIVVGSSINLYFSIIPYAASHSLVSVKMVDTETFLITATVQTYAEGAILGESRQYYISLPLLYHRLTHTVVDISGASYFSGDVHIVDGGSLFCEDVVITGNVHIHKNIEIDNTLIHGALTMGDNSAIVSVTPPLMYSQIWNNWSKNNNDDPDFMTDFRSVSCSSTGQYILAGGIAALKLSSDYGVNWITPSIDSFIYEDSTMCMSSSGQYQLFIRTNNAINIYASNSYGVTWYGGGNSLNYTSFSPCCMSASGKHQFYAIYNSITFDPLYIIIIVTSHDYGRTTQNKFKYPVPLDVGILPTMSLVCSASGKNVSICFSKTVNEQYIYNSEDYGETYTIGLDAGTNNFVSMACSASGQYRTAIANNPTTFENTVYTSTDYGVTFTAGTTLFTGSSYIARSATVTMSASGQYQTTIQREITSPNVYVSEDFGTTWTTKTLPSNEIRYSVCMSSDAKYTVVGGESLYFSELPYSKINVQGFQTAVGHKAGNTGQQPYAVAVGYQSGENSQQTNSIAVGFQAGQHLQQTNSIAIGFQSGTTGQQNDSIAVGTLAGQMSQSATAIAIGYNAGQYVQSTNSIAIGFQAGTTGQQYGSIAMGTLAGQMSQSNAAIAIGLNAGQNEQNGSCVALGTNAGTTNQGIGGDFGFDPGSSVAIGPNAGNNNQHSNSVAIGSNAGANFQCNLSIAIGVAAGQFNQGISSDPYVYGGAVAMGSSAGSISQGACSVAIGQLAGYNNQSQLAVAIGYYAGSNSQGTDAVAVGQSAGAYNQQMNSVAIGYYAGSNSQGTNAIAMGRYAGQTNQHANSIVLNASGTTLNTTASGLFINPVRKTNINSAHIMAHDYNSTNEIIDISSITIDTSGNLIVSGTLDATNTIVSNTLSTNTIQPTYATGNNITIGAGVSNIINIGNVGNPSNSYSDTINIGGQYDNINFAGNITSTAINNLTIINKTIGLNVRNVADYSSAGSGIVITDNSNVEAAYMKVDLSMNGFIFKAPNKFPSLVTNGTVNNVVDLNVNSLTTSLGSGILMLQPSGTLHTDSSFVMNVSTLDISNILIRDSSLSTNTEQIVTTAVGITENASLGGALTMADNSSIVSVTSPLDYSQFGNYWSYYSGPDEGGSSNSVACSTSGQYVFECGETLLLSSNYGVNWYAQSIIGYDPYSSNTATCISASGQYQHFNQTNVGTQTVTVFQSSDYGITWTIENTLTIAYSDYVPCCMSASGEHRYMASFKSDFQGFTVYASHDYGATWLSQDFTRDPRYILPSLVCSASGRNVSFCINGTTDNLQEYIYNSTDYGVTYQPITTSNAGYNCLSMSASGQYVMAIVKTPSTYENTVYISDDYGITFAVSSTLFTGTSDARNATITVSASGQYQTVVQRIFTNICYISSDYGTTWRTIALTATQQNNCVCMSSDAKYMFIATGYYTLKSVVPQSETNVQGFYIGMGHRAGNSQNIFAVAIGNKAGENNQGTSAISIGQNAGQTNQFENTIAIGQNAGNNNQEMYAIGIGYGAGQYQQQTGAVAIGWNAGNNNQEMYAIGIGYGAGLNQKTGAVAIGKNAGQYQQQNDSIAVGTLAGQISQSATAIAIGYNAGQYVQSTNSIAIGFQAGTTGQQHDSIAMGTLAGSVSQSDSAIAIGVNAGQNGQNGSCVALGTNAGTTNQGTGGVFGFNTGSSVAIGPNAGNNNQHSNSVAIGDNAGANFQYTRCIAIGDNAGANNQGISSDPYVYGGAIAMGYQTGSISQGVNSVAIGTLAGYSKQLELAVAIGYYAGSNSQGTDAVAVGQSAGRNNQQMNSVAIGSGAGQNSQGTNAIAIGNMAGQTGQHANSIVLNASGTTLNTTASGLFVNPIRQTNLAGYLMAHDSNGTNEIIDVSNLTVDTGGNLTVEANTLLLGNVAIGIPTPFYSYNLDVSGTVRATSFNATSDYRIKSNVQTLNSRFSVDYLRPIHYFNQHANKEDIGFLAHEVQEHYPYLVSGQKDGEEHQSLNYNGIMGILVKDVKECRAEIRRLNREMATLLKDLKKRETEEDIRKLLNNSANMK